MTGRELIMYILNNNLEDEPVFKNGVFVGYMSVDDAAVKMDVGRSTVLALIAEGKLEHIRLGPDMFNNTLCFIPDNFNKKGE